MSPGVYFPTTRDAPRSGFGRAVDALANLFFPDECLACRLPLGRLQDRGLCDGCWEKILALRIRPPWCPSCGLPYQQWGEGGSHLCSECILRPPPYSGARSFGFYSLELRRGVHALKFSGRRNLVDLLAPQLGAAFYDTWTRSDADVIIPIPLHPVRTRARGFNQSALLAERLSRLLGIPWNSRVLLRVRDTAPQVNLTDRERFQNVRRAFLCKKPQAVAGKQVLLVDDVMTTGATVRSAAGALLKGGAHRVWVLTLARAVPGVMV